MGYVISILLMATVMTVWGYFFSKWKAAKGGGGCGGCSAFGGKGACKARRSGGSQSCQAHSRATTTSDSGGSRPR